MRCFYKHTTIQVMIRLAIFLFCSAAVLSLKAFAEPSAKQFDFTKMRNATTVYGKWQRGIESGDYGFIQYGVDKDDNVRYIIISSKLEAAALVTLSISQVDGHDRSVVTARIELPNRKVDLPDGNNNFLLVTQSGVSRGRFLRFPVKLLHEYIQHSHSISLVSLKKFLQKSKADHNLKAHEKKSKMQ